MKRLLIFTIVLALLLIEAGCASHGNGGSDPHRRQEKINIDVD